MPSLYDTLAGAEGGKAIERLGREFGLTPQQTEAAVMALLPAISTGLKQATATPEGLGNLFSVMGYQRDLHAMYGDPKVALAPEGRAAGNDVLSVIFGSPDVSRAVVDQAQQFSGVSSSILKKLLPVLAGVLISGLMRGKSGQAAPTGHVAPPQGAAGLEISLARFSDAGCPAPVLLRACLRNNRFRCRPTPVSQPAPGGDLLGYILRELEKAIREGRIKPVIIGADP